MSKTYRILERKRAGESLSDDEIQYMVQGAADGSLGDGELGAFLMAAAIRGLDSRETRTLTVAMADSGERWRLGAEIPALGDKHSTGGVGDKVSLVLAPLLAACGQPVVMLAGRGLGHTGGTADKLESVPGISLDLDRQGCLHLLQRTGMAMGVATSTIAPADRRFYGLRNRTATVDSLPLMTSSILSKKAATGAAAVVFDVKTGNGAFLPEEAAARTLASLLVETARGMGMGARALVTDMSQPLGRWVGHTAEVREALDCLSGEGPEDLMEVTFQLAQELGELTGTGVRRMDLEGAVASGRSRETFDEWAAAQGARREWLRRPECPLAPVEGVVEASRGGVVSQIDTRQLGFLLAEAGGGRVRPGEAIDFGVAFRCQARLGEEVAKGEELARVYLRREDPSLLRRFAACFTVAENGEAPPLIRTTIGRSSPPESLDPGRQ